MKSQLNLIKLLLVMFVGATSRFRNQEDRINRMIKAGVIETKQTRETINRATSIIERSHLIAI